MSSTIKDFEFDLQTIQSEFYINRVNSLNYESLKIRYSELIEDSRLGEDKQKHTKEFEHIQLIGENVKFVAKTLIFWMGKCNTYERYDFKNKTLNPYCDEFKKEINRMYSYSLA